MATHVKLSTVKPDFESITSQLKAALQQKASWLTLTNSSTGSLLIEAQGMIGEYDQYSIMSAVHETTLENAHLAESIYTNCRFLGVRIHRKTPAHCQINLQNTDYTNPFVEIPAYTQFTIEGAKYFNREAIVFNDAINMQEATLYQGEVKTAIFNADGSSYQTYNIEETEPWSISNDDIICNVGEYTYSKSTEPLFLFKSSDYKFYENTLPNGQVECKFGNGIYGAIPEDQQQIIFTYTVTNGSLGNNNITEQKVTCQDYAMLVGETITNSSGGSDQPSLDFYQQLGAQAGASNGRGIIRDDYKALVVAYPGVIDCNVYGQAEIAPLDKDWMNVVGLMLLTDDTFNDTSWKSLVTYLKSKSIFGLQYVKFDPEPVVVDIDVTVYMKPKANLTVSRDLIIQALTDMSKLKLGSLGRGLYASDVEDVIFSTLPTTVDYINKKTPNIDYIITRNQYIKVNSINVQVLYSERDSQSFIGEQ